MEMYKLYGKMIENMSGYAISYAKGVGSRMPIIGNKSNSSNSFHIDFFSVLIIPTIRASTYFLDLCHLSYDIGF